MFRGDGNLLTSLLLGQKSAASESLPSSHLKTNVLPHVVESVCRILFETRRNHNCSRQRSCVLPPLPICECTHRCSRWAHPLPCARSSLWRSVLMTVANAALTRGSILCGFSAVRIRYFLRCTEQMHS